MHAYTAISLAYIMNIHKQIPNAHTPNQAWEFLFFPQKKPEEAERKIKTETVCFVI